ncbi:MAG TPA: glycosyltransferase family 39 protein [Opitutaceae bacterium]|nr:glycosyltransferase family 39 protein [Opitutaceae bacterium]
MAEAFGIDRWRRRLCGPLAAAVLLAGFWFLMLASLREKSATADEIGHAAAGYSYWRLHDYRLDPENGVLPDRLMALPFLFSHDRFPSTDSETWRGSYDTALAYDWFYRMGNDAGGMLRRGRAICGLLAVALGALVWWWARRLFGPAGGLLALLLYVFNPSILANGALMNSDAACALFFLAATGSMWAVLHRLTMPRVLGSALIVGGLFVTKMSAALIVPIAAVLVVARLIDGRPLPVEIGSKRELRGRGRQAAAFALAAAAHVAVAAIIIWACYGFRYSIFAQAEPGRDRLTHTWASLLGKPDPLALIGQLGLNGEQQTQAMQILSARHLGPLQLTNEYDAQAAAEAIRDGVLTLLQRREFDARTDAPPPAPALRVIDFFRRHRLLPEPFLYGLASTWRNAGQRAAFFNGRFDTQGQAFFFPYTFLVKTPLAMFAVMALALAAAVARWRAWDQRPSAPVGGAGLRAGYETLPLWALQAVYWAAAIPSHLNIGHRHILPVYAPLCVLGGAAAWWLGGADKRPEAGRTIGAPEKAARLAGVSLCVLMPVLAVEMMYWFPNYLAYFNGIVHPSRAYRHLVDSSLDWGQDLPAVKRYIERHRLNGPVYLSYFGNSSPDYYEIPAAKLHSNPGWDVPPLIQAFKLPPDETGKLLADRLRRQPDYELVGSRAEPVGGRVVVLLQKPAAMNLKGGTYFISATMLQPVAVGVNPFGPWNEKYEAMYQDCYEKVRPLLAGDEAVRMAALREHTLAEWQEVLNYFDAWRFGRLTAYLRQREPNDNVNFSILVYKLTDKDIASALDGPPPYDANQP